MKKLALIAFAAVLLFAAVSCSTTQAADVEPVVKEVSFKDYTDKSFSEDQIYSMLKMFADEYENGGEDEEVVIDDDSRTVTIKNVEFAGNVGMAAQDGTIVADIVLSVKEDAAVVSIVFVDSYMTVWLGPIAKNVSQGITELGLKQLAYQADYISQAFANTIAYYSILVDQGLI